MDSFFNKEILDAETKSFNEYTNLVHNYLRMTYFINKSHKQTFVDELKGAGVTQLGAIAIKNDSYWTESIMKNCFKKCKQFVLEDWIDYDELDCTMRCTLLNKKAVDVLNETLRKV